MQRQVIPLMVSDQIDFTSRSSNITIGKYIVIQRKGSRMGKSGSDPMSIDHGSNHVQIKMRVKKFFENIEPVSRFSI